MPVLKNARREIFAQALAEGREVQDAYVIAGFKANSGNASTLKDNKDVQRRVSELLNKRANKVLKKSAREAEVTRDFILDKLQKAFDLAQKVKNPSAMTMAAVGMARVTGNIIDRREIGEVGAFSDKTDEELRQIASERAARLGLNPDPHAGLGPKLVVDNCPEKDG
jgi:phage terminase small subunit